MGLGEFSITYLDCHNPLRLVGTLIRGLIQNPSKTWHLAYIWYSVFFAHFLSYVPLLTQSPFPPTPSWLFPPNVTQGALLIVNGRIYSVVFAHFLSDAPFLAQLSFNPTLTWLAPPNVTQRTLLIADGIRCSVVYMCTFFHMYLLSQLPFPQPRMTSPVHTSSKNRDII